MLDKLSGKWAPKPSAGPHKSRECLPLVILLRNRLKYALRNREVTMILMQRLVKVDGQVRTDSNYPAGFQDVITIERTNELFRLLYDTKGRFVAHRITPEESKFKLLRVRKTSTGAKGVPFAITHDGRTIRYPDPLIKTHDVVKFDLHSGKVVEFYKFEVGNVAMITGGRNMGRVGIVTSRERHEGSFDIVHVTDAAGHPFATRIGNVFIIGKGNKPAISLPARKGIKVSVIEERELRLKKLAATA